MLAMIGLISTSCARSENPSQATDPAVTDPAATGGRRVVLESEVITVDRMYHSMDGPSLLVPLDLEPEHRGALLWLTAVRNEAIAAGTGARLSQEFLCHSNLAITSREQLARRSADFDATDNLEARLITLIQGQNEVRLPAGFGLPIVAGEPLELFSMVINRNEANLPFDMRVRTTVEYTPDGMSETPIVPLFRRRLFSYVQTEDPQHPGSSGDSRHPAHRHAMNGPHAMNGQHGDADTMAETAQSAVSDKTLGRDAAGSVYTMHWLVPPGRHVYRTPTRSQLKLGFDTTLHYVTGHLHPFGRSIALIDLTTGEEVFHLTASAYASKIGIEKMESFTSREGKPIYQDRAYELVTVYDNPTDAPIDAMAIVYLHLRDQEFRRLGRHPHAS